MNGKQGYNPRYPAAFNEPLEASQRRLDASHGWSLSQAFQPSPATSTVGGYSMNS